MKRYEKMEKEEIIKAMCIDEGDCKHCIACSECGIINEKTCNRTRASFIRKDIEQIPRCHKCKTVQDFIKMEQDWTQTDYSNLAEYAMEDVEK